MIRVLLIDDHALVRAGLARLIASDPELEVVGDAGDGSTGATLARDLKPDVALVDLAMPGLDGIQTTRRVLNASAATQVVVLTAFSDRAQVLAALDAGACGYLLKDAEPDELLRGIRAAARGDSPLDPRAAHAVLTRETVGATLTAREREVLKLVADGLPNKQIARALGITEKTVKAHMTKIFAAIGVTDRTAAALWAHRNGVR
ncbi:response regulator [Solirubrobacter soli]|uniref:response regulator n=1 Tax=Solirubrobacter soli TaxID=363832 RepID=UPI00040FDAF4|nr:response regulator transcription factor [Solirubrobacter soli]